MKTNLLIPLFAFTFVLHLAATAAVPLRWTVETSRATPAQFEAYQGETLALEAALQSYGKPLEASGIAALYWQTNGMGSAYWEATAAVNSNRLSAVWTPEMDVGAKSYNCFIGVPGTVYHAAFQLRLRPSPGALPNTLPLPVPVIDFAKVRVLNPPWEGGGGVNTNAVRDIAREEIEPATNRLYKSLIDAMPDGAAKILPKYLECRDFFDSYKDDAEWYYSQPQDYGRCSAVRDGNFLYRNLDWKFNDAVDFIVRMYAGDGRFASVGVANCGTNLTEEIVTSGKLSRYYKCLPGHTVDGINENGVCAEVNVTDGDPDYWDNPDGDIHPLGAVRWVLDHATNALHAATELATRVKFPNGWTQNFHWMIADKYATYIVEDGEYHEVTGRAVMTNFKLYPAPVFGQGWERYKLLSTNATANIKDVWFTRAYSPDTDWVSEFTDREEMNAAKIAWAIGDKESHRGEHIGNKWWWQTVHTSLYNLTDLTLKIAVQETDDWYVFQMPSGGKVRSVNGNTGDVVLSASDVHALPDDYTPPVEADPVAMPRVSALESSVSTLQSSVSGLESSKRDKTDFFVSEGEWDFGAFKASAPTAVFRMWEAEGTSYYSLEYDEFGAGFTAAAHGTPGTSPDGRKTFTATSCSSRFYNLIGTVLYKSKDVYLAKTTDIKPESDPVFNDWRTNAQSVVAGIGAGTANGVQNGVAVGSGANIAGGSGSVAIGFNAKANYATEVAVGAASEARNNDSVAVGFGAHGFGRASAQIGTGQNDSDNSLKFRGTVVVNGNGEIPVASLDTPVRSIYDDNVYAVQNDSFGPWSWNDSAFNNVIPRYGQARTNSWSVQLPSGYTFDGDSTAVVDATMNTTYIAFVAQHNGESVLITAVRQKPAPVPTGDKFVRQSDVDSTVTANLNKYVDGETGIEYVGKYYGGNLYYVPTGNVYPPNN